MRWLFVVIVGMTQDVLRKSCTAEGLRINLVRLLSIKKGNENISISFDTCRDDKI